MARRKKKSSCVCYVSGDYTKCDDNVFKRGMDNWEYSLKKRLDKDGIEIHTDDILDVNDSEYVVVSNNVFYRNLDVMWKLYDKKLLHNSVYVDYNLESFIHDKKEISELANIFKKIITNDDCIVDGEGIIKGNITNNFTKSVKSKKSFSEKKLLMMISDNICDEYIIKRLNFDNSCTYFNKSNILKYNKGERDNIIDFFYNKNCLDLYGSYWKKYKLYKFISNEDRITTINNYRFILLCDNLSNENTIPLELFEYFKAECVPIYIGKSLLYNYVPLECYIDMRDFKNYEELYRFLENMDEDTYNEYIKNINKFLKSSKYKNHFSADASGEVIYNALLSDDKGFSYEAAYNSLMYFENKRLNIIKNMSLQCFGCKINIINDCVELIFRIKYDRHDLALLVPYVNGEEFKWSEEWVEDGVKYYKIIIYDNSRKFKFRVKYNYKDYSDFITFTRVFSREFYFKNNNKELIYSGYVEMNFISKFIYILIHKKKWLFRKIFKYECYV